MRIAAVLRRGRGRDGARASCGSARWRSTRRRARRRVAGARVELAAKEFALLRTLASAPTRVFTKEELLRDVWGYRAVGATRTLDSHACRLRQKLRDGERRVHRQRLGRGLPAGRRPVERSARGLAFRRGETAARIARWPRRRLRPPRNPCAPKRRRPRRRSRCGPATTFAAVGGGAGVVRRPARAVRRRGAGHGRDDLAARVDRVPPRRAEGPDRRSRRDRRAPAADGHADVAVLLGLRGGPALAAVARRRAVHRARGGDRAAARAVAERRAIACSPRWPWR